MHLIADGGSTKVDWILLDKNGVIEKFESQGLNPNILPFDTLKNKIQNIEPIKKYKKDITSIYFYGAGCGTELAKQILHNAFKSFFENINISVKEDTYAAVYAFLTIEPCIVSIIGTGSNSCYFDGEKIHEITSSLGYTIMDEASGNYFGKILLQEYFYKRMPITIAKKFESEYNLDPDHIKEKLYRSEKPNMYLASFAKFMSNYKDDQYIEEIIKEGFSVFFDNKISTLKNSKNLKIHFVGSIAFYFKDLLKEVGENKGYNIGYIKRKPIHGLIEHHQKLINKI